MANIKLQMIDGTGEAVTVRELAAGRLEIGKPGFSYGLRFATVTDAMWLKSICDKYIERNTNNPVGPDDIRKWGW